ncbi:MAG: flagellar hook-basal body complex protein FliE [Firmicutes bacterium HGW-Firmicutes-14]|nr:MAG: flagellar hook-basal body complex protein FliE [Firmicutes bacterium HGW-Firmicutes-14]
MSPLEILQTGQKLTEQPGTGKEQKTGFADLLKGAINEVNALQNESQEAKVQLVTGEAEDLHQVMIAAEKANLAFQMTVQIRNKVVEAYQEIMRMQV